jgi:hypothetical protein
LCAVASRRGEEKRWKSMEGWIRGAII